MNMQQRTKEKTKPDLFFTIELIKDDIAYK